MKNNIIPYNPKLRAYAKELRKNSTLAEVLLWQNIKNRVLGVQFHRQVPLLEYIVDFYCHELQLAIEINGDSHKYKYEADSKRQGLLEERGVRFIRFSDEDIKKNMFSVGLSIEETVREMGKIRVSKNTPLTPPSKGESTRKNFGFPKKEKLKSKKLIDKLFSEGKNISVYPIKLIYLKTELPSEVAVQASVSVSKKNFKSAVKRNRIKRLLRESYRLNKALIFNNSNDTFAFLFLYLGKQMPDFQTIDDNVKTVLLKFKKKIDDD